MTIFKLQPIGLPEIDFNTVWIKSATNGFHTRAETFEFNENQRIEIVYSNTTYGGRAVSDRKALVPINFEAYIVGSSRDELLERAHTLNKALMNPKGGLLEYRPQNSTISTFYRYEASRPASLMEADQNIWDGNVEGDGKHFIGLNVELMTQPVATSSLLDITPSRTSIQNTYTGTYFNYLDLLDIKGDLPALVQLKMTNQTGAVLNRVYICSRSSVLSTLDNISQVYEAESASGDGTWSNQAEANRSSGSYKRHTSTSLDSWNTLKFTLNNEQDHRGFTSILAVVRPSSTASNWRVRLSYHIGSNIIWTANANFKPEFSNKWHFLYIGDIQLPPMATSELTTISPTLGVDVKQVAGSIGETLDIDFVELFFSDESILQINLKDNRSSGISNDQKVLTTFEDSSYSRVTQAINSSDQVLFVPDSVYGSVLGIEAKEDTRIFFAFERDSSGHLHIAGDQINVETKIIYRSIYPFGD